MVKLLIIDKLGSIGELNIKNLLREDLYKRTNKHMHHNTIPQITSTTTTGVHGGLTL